ncbi:hypothetical protein J7J18_03595 [bacterium]|nr:hypothetical protein [bacterium]
MEEVVCVFRDVQKVLAEGLIVNVELEKDGTVVVKVPFTRDCGKAVFERIKNRWK